MRERYIFFALLIIAAVLFIGSRVGKKSEGEISVQEKVLQRKLKRAAELKPAPVPDINIEQVQNLVAFATYEPMIKRSPFFKGEEDLTADSKKVVKVAPVEEQTPVFIYKGKIASGNRLLVIIEQTRSGETFMVSKNELLNGYKVLDITNTEVILSKKGEENIVLKTIETP